MILYNIFLHEFVALGNTNPIYQQPMLSFLYKGLSWDIEKFKEANMTTSLKTFKTLRVTLDSIINKSYLDLSNPILREVDYLKCITVLIGYFPEIFPD